ncbi:hypothetical protein ACFOHS_09995 [Jhaorihella thermophila]
MKKPAGFTCTACGASYNKWSGRCDACGEWNTITEDAGLSTGAGSKSLGARRGRSIALTDLATDEAPAPARKAGWPSLTGCWAADWCRPRPSWWAAIRASANPPCCSKPPPGSPGPG